MPQSPPRFRPRPSHPPSRISSLAAPTPRTMTTPSSHNVCTATTELLLLFLLISLVPCFRFFAFALSVDFVKALGFGKDAQSETDSTDYSTNDDDDDDVAETSIFKFTWAIKNFSRLKARKLYSDVFLVGGHQWRLLLFPKGNNVDSLSIYMDAADSASLVFGWTRFAHFGLTVIDQLKSNRSITKDSQNIFCAPRSDWGFPHFMPLSEVHNSSKGFLVNDTLIIEADVTVLRFGDWSYEDRKETGLAAVSSRVVDCYQNWTDRVAYSMKVLNRMIPPLLDVVQSEATSTDWSHQEEEPSSVDLRGQSRISLGRTPRNSTLISLQWVAASGLVSVRVRSLEETKRNVVFKVHAYEGLL
ncbi:ubiquitin carboxyl-terminal hydrolase [Musa troglodytarum]|uniref:Ubiquitin carboxyl-terminal hydrolase n=1 Tax=Musa troglodytarum TaxID=320322 RepID=A0A9E7KET9_9LILI|nr:ubiquitin carboxyl-terminal hydrolase [Musa troglodytarum]